MPQASSEPRVERWDVLYWQNWWRQAQAAYRAGVHTQEADDHAYACFLFQQAAELAFKAGLDCMGSDHRTHDLTGLMSGFQELPPAVAEAARRLNDKYVRTRYPDAVEGAVPAEMFGQQDAVQARADADVIMRFVESRLG